MKKIAVKLVCSKCGKSPVGKPTKDNPNFAVFDTVCKDCNINYDLRIFQDGVDVTDTWKG